MRGDGLLQRRVAIAVVAVNFELRQVDRQLAKRLLGLELLMEAGVREIVKEEQGIDWATADAETQRLFSVGSELLR